MTNGAENSSSKLSRIYSLSLVSKAESSDKNLTDILMNQSGLKEPGKINVSKIGERFQRKLENLRNYYALKNLRCSTVWSEAKYIFYLLNFIPFLLSVRESGNKKTKQLFPFLLR